MRRKHLTAWLRFSCWLGLAALAAPAPAQSVERIIFGLTNSWRYNQTTSYDGVNWTAPGFNDTALPSGRGVLALEDSNAFVTSRTNTVLTLGRTTYYFRTPFNFTNSPNGVTLTFSNIVDDGAVFYLNGREINRLFMPPAPAVITDATLATSHEATGFEVFTLSGPIVTTNLVTGTNVLAVEVHQTTTGSSDIVFGLALSATLADTNPPPTLRMPPAPPVLGYTLSNAFPGLSISQPIGMATPPGETNRLFILERDGRVVVITNLAAPTRTVFLDISGPVITGGEEGLLGLAFHPGYETNRYFYLFYSLTTNTTAGAGRHQRLARFQATAGNPSSASPATELPLITQFDDYSNHNGGDIHFGNDGYLYVSLGDEGDQNDLGDNSQRIDKDFFAGILRIDVDRLPGNLPPKAHASLMNMTNYFIPADNPWVGAVQFNGLAINTNALRAEFWAVGMRNPWRMSFDRPTGTLYVGDVGGGAREEVNVTMRGGNYGWAYREGTVNGPKSGQAPANFNYFRPILEYAHGTATNQGNSITGGVLYRGSRLPGLTGRYVFADYVSGHFWALTPNGTNTVPFEYLFTDANLVAFGADPSNGDVLVADIADGQIKRLVAGGIASGTPLPPTLFDTGAFTNLTSLSSPTAPLTANAGLVPYDINVPFWSDNAHKSRWFFVPNTNLTLGFNARANWSFPTGVAWVKHFDLELTNGVPSSARRLETRILVRNTNGVYGVTYRWGNSLTNAALVPDQGMDESFTVYDGGVARTQIWHYPGRGECLSCHTPVAGHALGFNTPQLNRDFDYGAGPTNQLAALSRAGYLSGLIADVHSLDSLAPATNEAASLEWRVRSYLAANCASCHLPGGPGLGAWTASLTNTTATAGLINGLLNNSGGDPANRVVVPGDPAHSMLLTRISYRGPGQMPPLSSTVVDAQAVALLSRWITNDLPAYRTFAQWQMDNFGSTNAPNALAGADPDQDRSTNYGEYLAGTDPNSAASAWTVSIDRNGDEVQIGYPRLIKRGIEIQWNTNLLNPAGWRFLNVPENRPFFPAAGGAATVPDSITGSPTRFYRGRIFER